MDAPPTKKTAGTLAQEKRRKDYLVGILLLLSVVLLWTASNFLTNTVLTRGYDKPFAVTYANTSSFALYLIPFALVGSKSRRRNRSQGIDLDQDQDELRWWEKLGFALPPTSSELARGSYKQLPNDSEVSNEPPSNKRPSSPADIGSDARGRHSSTLQIDSLAVPSTNGLSASNEGPGEGAHFGTLTRSTARPRSRNPLHSQVRARSPTPHRPSSIDGRRPRSILLSRRDSVNSLLVQPLPIVNRSISAISSREIELQNLPPLTLKETAALAATFTLVWFAANWSLNAGLGLTSVASGTTLSSASGFFTLALGSVFGVEAFSIGKLGAVTMSFLGVALVTWADSDDSPSDLGAMAAPINAPLGDALALLSAFFYAVYVTLLKLRIGSEDRVSMPLFFGFVGAFNILAMWPVGLVLSLSGIERFEWPSDTLTWIGIVINMSITFVSDFAYLLAMLKSSPLLATVGLSLTIPLAVAGDLVRGSHSGGIQADLGSIVVLLSFVAIALADESSLSIPSDSNEEPLNPNLEGAESSSGFTYGDRSSSEINFEEDEGTEADHSHLRPNNYNSIDQISSKRADPLRSSSSFPGNQAKR